MLTGAYDSCATDTPRFVWSPSFNSSKAVFCISTCPQIALDNKKRNSMKK